MRVAIYGNLIYDQLITLDTPLAPGMSHNCKMSHAAGGIANFCRAAVTHFDMSVVSKVGNDDYGKFMTDEVGKVATLFVPQTTEPTTVATVIVDKVNCMRTGLVRWGACRSVEGWNPVNSGWRHLMYLDRITITIDELKLLGAFPISADFCTIEDIDDYWYLLPYIDYLIVSEDESRSLADRDIPVRKGIIVHSPKRVYFKNKRTLISFSVPMEENLNVVGAGDYFAAYTIANLLVDEFPNLQWIHERTIEMIRRQS